MEQNTLLQCKECNTVFLTMGTSPNACKTVALQALRANTVEATTEKHIPILAYTKGKLTVTVGSIPHPMADDHYIEWILVETNTGGQYHNLVPGEKPEAVFDVSRCDVLRVYAYCNLHGLWLAAGEAFAENEEAVLG